MITRDATRADIAEIAPFFRAIVDAGETYAYPEEMSDEHIAAIWLEPAPGRCIVAVNDAGRIVGSAKIGPNRPGRGAHVATSSFMVDPESRSRGVGRALGEEAIRWARSAGYQAMQFNAVVETNTAAVRLWRSLGFEIMATIPEAFDSKRHGLVGLHIMHQRF
jgi:L-amino acid N-acyltransferase YncA